jgi:hypothetical protein
MESKSDSYTVLYLEICNKYDSLLKIEYEHTIFENNKNVNSHYPDSGFDIFTPNPKNLSIKANSTNLINLGIKCACYKFKNNTRKPNKLPKYEFINTIFKSSKDIEAQPFHIYSRSSIWKTPFRLSNKVGVIDSGYRGFLYSAVDNISNKEASLEPINRYFQICMSDLRPFYVVLVNEIKNNTDRGKGGFGSTGI